MSNHASSSKTFNWPKVGWSTGIALSAVLLMGQSCTINIGNSQPLDGGVYRSDDHGTTWRAKNFVSQVKKRTVTIGDATGLDFEFRPKQPDTLYLGTRENGLWLSTDGGDHWQATSLRTGAYPCIDFDPDNADIMYTVSGTLALKSTNGGKQWATTYTESQPGQAVTCIAVDPNRGNILWLVTSGGKIIQSDDYGQTWRLKLTVPGFLPRKLLVDPDGSGKLYVFTQTNGFFVVSADGTTYTNLTPALKDFKGSSEIRAVEAHINPTRWWIATRGGLLTSTDKGATWKLVQTLINPGSVPINTIAVNPNDDLDLFITTTQKLHHTKDGGVTWTVTTLPTSRLPALLTFSPKTPDRLYFATFRPEKKQ